MTDPTAGPPASPLSFAALLAAMSSAALDTLADFDRDAALGAGLDPARVSSWAKLQRIYFGTTRFGRQQRRAAGLARDGRFSLDQLAMIERRMSQLTEAERWRMRIELLETRCSYAALSAKAAALIPQKGSAPRKEVKFGASKSGMRKMTVTGEERDIADLEHALSRGLDPTKPAAPQLHDAFVSLMREGGGVPRAAARPMVLVPLEAHLKIVAGDGDDTVLGLTDGTTITGTEYLTLLHAAELELALIHPAKGAVNLYRTQRLANQKQRDLARVMMPICPVPGCRHGADACEIHHVTAWRAGGQTNIANLAPLCRYHNRVNDDDPKRARRGRIEMMRGTPVWVSPRGYPATNPVHPFAAARLLFEEPAGAS